MWLTCSQRFKNMKHIKHENASESVVDQYKRSIPIGNK